MKTFIFQFFLLIIFQINKYKTEFVNDTNKQQTKKLTNSQMIHIEAFATLANQ